MQRESDLVPTSALLFACLGLPSTALAEGGLNLVPDWTVLGVNLIALALLIYPVNRWLLAPLVQVLLAREERTSGALARATRLSDETAQLQTEVEARLADARARGLVGRGQIMSEAQEAERRLLTAAREEAGSAIDAVRASVREELEGARNALQRDARQLAREAAVQVLGRPL